MHVALGYHWFAASLGYHLERSIRDQGHAVTYVGTASGQRAAFDTSPLPEVLGALAEPPDLYLWVDSAGRYFPRGIELASVPTAGYFVDVHLGTWRLAAARFFDVVFVAQKDYVETFRNALGHGQVYWLPLAAASDVHYDHHLPRIYEVGFVGNLALAHRGTARARRLKLVAERFNTNDFFRPYTAEQVGEIYSQSRIVINTSIAGDVNMRVFEATACGALALTDSTRNGLGELFEIGHEIVAYDDDADMLAKIEYHLAHEAEQKEIALAGERRACAQHTYHQRMADLLAITSAPGFRRCAPLRSAAPAAVRNARRTVYTHLHMLDAILDDMRASGANPVQRLWAILPGLMRRLLR